MKKLLSCLLGICILFSLLQPVYANAVEVEEVSAIKGMGLADEFSLLEKKGLLKQSKDENYASEEEKTSLKEQVGRLMNRNEEKPYSVEGESAKPEDIAILLDEYENKIADPTLRNESSTLMSTESATLAAVSYYSGTTIPTYTYVTGWPLRDSYTNNGYVYYRYYYYIDDYFDYIDYLIDYYGWEFYDSKTSDGGYGIVYLVKGYDMIAIIADFEYTETVIMFEAPSTVSPTSVSLDISSRTMIVGNQYTLEATVYPSNASDKSVTWSSSNSSVASVSSSGVVTAKAAGSATITAKTSNGKKATCSITVKKLVLEYYPNSNIPTFTCITGKSLYTSMEDDGTMMYFYTLDMESHTDYEAYLVNKDGWEILYEEVADDYSYFSAWYEKGDVKMLVMADFENGMTGIAFDANVSVTGIVLDKSVITLTEGNTQTITATVYPTNATNKTVTWTSSNTNVATVSTSGVVTAKAAGAATITAKTADGNKTATCTVNVTAKTISVTSVSLNKASVSISEGETHTLTATVYPTNATNKTVTWTSSNTNVATVSTSGVVTAKAVGTATITAKTADGNKTATCTVNVTAKIIAVTGVTLNKTSLAMSVGETQTLTATVYPTNATNKNVSWVSSNSSVATVSSSGVVTAIKSGAVTITVITKDGNKMATCDVVIRSVPSNITSFTYQKVQSYVYAELSLVDIPDGTSVYVTGYDSKGNMTSIKKVYVDNSSAQAIIEGNNVKKIKAIILGNKLSPLSLCEEKTIN